jgi:hypothetical protein
MSCPIYEVPFTDPRSNLRVVDSFDAQYTDQFAIVDNLNGNVYVKCSGRLDFLSPDTFEAKHISNGGKVSL